MLLVAGLFLLAPGIFSGAILVLLSLIAAAGLFLQGSSVIQGRGESFSLWYVLCVGLVLGAAGISSHRKDPAA